MKMCVASILLLFASPLFAQIATYVDRSGKRYSLDEVSRTRNEDQFIWYRRMEVTPDSVVRLIQFYPKDQVAARFQSEGEYCRNPTDRKTIAEIRRLEFYSRVKQIKLLAFEQTDSLGVHFIPKVKNDTDLSKAKEAVKLNGEMTDKLLDLLINFDAGDDVDVTFCDFDPRNAIVFFDHTGKQIGSIDLCFECLKLERSPQNIPLGAFCREAFYTLQGFFRSAGIIYGTRVHER